MCNEKLTISLNGGNGDCVSSGTVNSISCKACVDEYIGQTSRALFVHLKEHLVDKSKLKSNTPPHGKQKHNEDLEVEVTILALKSKASEGKTLTRFGLIP